MSSPMSKANIVNLFKKNKKNLWTIYINMAFTVLAVIVLCYSGYGVVCGIAKFPSPTLCTPPPPEKELGRGEMHRGAKGYLLTRAPLKELQLHFGCASGQTLDPPLRLWERLTHTEQERERERLEEEDWCCCGHASQGCKQKFFFVVPPLSSHCKWMGWGGSSGSVRSILLSLCVRTFARNRWHTHSLTTVSH